MIRIQLPPHLRTLARTGREVEMEIADPVTPRRIVDALEETYPVLRGTIRDHGTLKRRSMVRFFACERDISHDSPDQPVPEAIAGGREPFIILGAISGG